MKVHDRILLLGESFNIGELITLEQLTTFHLNKEVCKLIEKGVLIRLEKGIYTLSADYAQKSQKRKTKERFEDKISTLIHKYKVNDVITTKELRKLGFNSYNIAKLIEDGYIVRNKMSEYTIKSLEGSVEKKKLQDNPEPSAKLQNLYNGVLDNKKLTTQELKSYGFNSHEITKLLEKGVLKRIKKGLYEFLDVEGIYNYRIYVNRFIKGKCIDKCYEIDPKHIMANLKLFNRNIQNGYYNEAITYLENLYNYSDEAYRNSYNVYLFLLNMITELPDNLKIMADNLTLKDILSSSSDDKDSKNYDEIMINIFDGDFSYATLEAILSMPISFKKTIILNLVSRIADQSSNQEKVMQKDEFIQNIYNNNFEELQAYLSSKEAKSFLENNLLTIINIILEIINTGEIPKEEQKFTTSTFTAIKNNNIALALELSSEYCKTNGIKRENYPLNLLLVKANNLVELIKSINNKNYYRTLSILLYTNDNIILRKYLTVIVQAICDVLNDTEVTINAHNSTFEGAILAKDFAVALNLLDSSGDFLGKDLLIKLINDYFTIKNNKVKQSLKNSLDLIYNSLLIGDTKTAFTQIHEYLVSFNLEAYEFFVIDLIKLNLLERELGFTGPMQVLVGLANGTYTPSFDLYVNYFYEAIEEKKLEEAKLYYDIIAKFKAMGVLNIKMERIDRAMIYLKQEEIKKGR